MSNILFVYKREEPSVIMSEQLFDAFSKKYGSYFRSMLADRVQKKDLEWCDVFITVRSQSPIEAELMKLANKMKRVCACIYDDDFLAIKNYKQRRFFQRKALLTVLKNSQIIFSTNDLLGQKYSKLGHNSRFVRVDTAIEEEEICKEKDYIERNVINIAYYVNDGTTTVFDDVIKPVMAKINTDILEKIRWVFIGVKPQLEDYIPYENIIYVPHMPLYEFREFLRKFDFTFGIAPLVKSEFASAKYINKYMEFSTAGIPCIYSNVTPYAEFIQDGYDGILCNNTVDEWIEAFGKMESLEFRKKCVQNAQMRIRKEFSQNGILERMENEAPEIIAFTAPKTMRVRGFRLAKCYVMFVEQLDPFARMLGRLKTEGLVSVIQWIWKRR